MIDDYVNKLIENLPTNSKKLQRIDLVLDGGVFNGSYLVGAHYFLKEMERRKYVQIDNVYKPYVPNRVKILIESLILKCLLRR